MHLVGSIVDGEALLNVVWASLAAGLGVTLAFAVAIFGTTRAVDLRRDGHAAQAAVFAVVGVLALAVVAAAIVLGIIVMTSK